MQQSVPWGLDNLNPCRDKKKDVFQTVTPLFFSWLAFMTWKHLKVLKDVLFSHLHVCPHVCLHAYVALQFTTSDFETLRKITITLSGVAPHRDVIYIYIYINFISHFLYRISSTN